MIITQWSNTRHMQLAGFSGSQDSKSLSGGSSSYTSDICMCLNECEYKEFAFVNSSGDNWWQNDLTSLIAGRIFAADTIDFILLKDDVQIAVLNSNTFGTFFDYGSLYNPTDEDYLTSLAYLNYLGYIVEWKKVKQAFGYGEFRLKTKIVSLGETYEKISHIYNVLEYNQLLADGTVRIETYQKGSIMNGFDYTGINWYQSIRISGKFWNKKPSIIKNNYQDTQRNIIQIQDKIENVFTLETALLPSNIYNSINYDGLLANDIFITDYNLYNQELYRREAVDFENFEDVTNHENTTISSFIYTFKSRKDNIVKRNIDGYNNLLPYQSNIVSSLPPLDAILKVNGDDFTTIPSGDEFDLPVKNTINIEVGAKIGSEWIVPDADISINGVTFISVESGGSEDIIVKDDLGTIVGSKIGSEWIVPSGPPQSGIVYEISQFTNVYTSYDTNGFDDGGRIQSGFYNYVRPLFPLNYARIDLSISNGWFRLVDNNIFGNLFRFTDVDGGQTFSATNNKDSVFIDHLTGFMWTARRGVGQPIGGSNWQNSIDIADSFSIVVNGATYNDWFRPSSSEVKALFGNVRPDTAFIDGAVTIIGAGSDVITSSTRPNNTGLAYIIDSGGQTTSYNKTYPIGGIQLLFRKHLW